MRLVYRGVDISAEVAVRSAVHETCAFGRLPSLRLTFDDDGTWDRWGPGPGDGIEAGAAGMAPTGPMHVTACRPAGGAYEIDAGPLPAPDRGRAQGWRSTALPRVAAQVASQLGLGCELHGAAAVELARVEQRGMRGMELLGRLAALLGFGIDAHGGALHLYSLEWAASQASAGTLAASAERGLRWRGLQPLASCELVQEARDGAPRIAATCGAGDPALGVVLAADGPVAVATSEAARRMARGSLVHANARRVSGSCAGGGPVAWTAGSAIDVECAEAPSLSGRRLATRTRCDLVSGESRVWWTEVPDG